VSTITYDSPVLTLASGRPQPMLSADHPVGVPVGLADRARTLSFIGWRLFAWRAKPPGGNLGSGDDIK
jgi:hypothetical protein